MADQRLIPPGIRDASTVALNELIDRIGTLDITPLLVYLIDSVEETALPHLAEQFSVTGYDGWVLTRGTADQREIIKRAVAIHRRKGTPWAVKQAISALGFTGDITEWFQYDGLPFHYRAGVTVTDGRQITVQAMRGLITLIQEYQNTRSRLDIVTVTAVQPGAVAAAYTGITSVVITTPPRA